MRELFSAKTTNSFSSWISRDDYVPRIYYFFPKYLKNDIYFFSYGISLVFEVFRTWYKNFLETLDEQTTDEFINAEAKKLPPKVDQERLNMKDQLFYNEDLQSNRFIFDLKSKNIFQVIVVYRLLGIYL